MKVNLSPPWVTFYRKIQTLLKQDPDVFTLFDQEEMIIKVYTADQQKAEALEHLLVKSAAFGSVTVNVQIIPGNGLPAERTGDIYEAAFSGNGAFYETKEITIPFAGKLRYVVWTWEVAQFYNDNLADVNGNMTMLYEQVARDVLIEEPGVFHCTTASP